MAEMVNTNQFKNGMHIELDGSPWRILDSGAVVDRTFRAGEKFPRVHTEVKNAQYLYDSGDEVVFMDEENYEQFSLSRDSVSDALDFLEPSSTVQMMTVD